MNVNNPKRTIFINHNNQKLLLRFEINRLIENLVLTYEVYILKQNSIAPTISETLKNNPEADVVNTNSIPVNLAFKEDSIALGKITETFLYIQGLTNEYSNKQQEYAKVVLFGTTIFFPYLDLYNLYTFLGNIVNNYDTIKLRMFSNNTVEEDTNKKIEEEPNLNADVIEDILKLSPNKIVNYYIIKWVNSVNFARLEYKDNKLPVVPILDFTLFNYSRDNFIVLDEVINLIKDDRMVSVNKIKQLFRYVYSISASCKEKEEVSPSEGVYLSICAFLIFIYGIKVFFNNLNIEEHNLKAVFLHTINKCISQIQEKENISPEQSTLFKLVSVDSDKSMDLNLDTISEVSKKYKYLLKIDADVFLDKVLNENTSGCETESNQPKIKYKRVVDNPTIISILEFTSDKSDGLLSYGDFASKKNKQHTVLTKAYDQILSIENGEKFKKGQLIPILTKTSDIIVNHIFKKVNSNPELAEWSSMNTLVLMDSFIDPFMPEEASEKTRRFILYQVLIPHLHNLYGLEKIIDYFH